MPWPLKSLDHSMRLSKLHTRTPYSLYFIYSAADDAAEPPLQLVFQLAEPQYECDMKVDMCQLVIGATAGTRGMDGRGVSLARFQVASARQWRSMNSSARLLQRASQRLAPHKSELE